MCGGALEIKEGMSVCECQYCGTVQTLPNLDDEKKIRLYDRANHFRRNNEFDKAMGIYESILAEDDKDAEAYWSLVLCRYGIEYVEDPATHKRVPTVNRAQYTSVFIDEDYQSALKYADGYQRDIYEKEAKAIDEIQKGILEISNKEEPFDVFICYKETDISGRRTQDSVFAQDIYKALTDEGYKVFFSRITLEDKLGTEYEPYIFAALHSAPVMIVVGTSVENLNSVWVKNEWSRYLGLVKAGEDKTLIPVYKNMDPYDLPEEFSYLQAQDMNKVGFMQDLVRGVKKIISHEVIDERQKKGTSTVIVDTMTKRGGEALASGDWDTAIRCYDSILDYDSRNVDALIGKLKGKKQVIELEQSTTALETEKEYERLLNFADSETKEKLEKINQDILETIQQAQTKAKKKKRVIIISSLITAVIIAAVTTVILMYPNYIKPAMIYNDAKKLMQSEQYEQAIETFESIGGTYKDSAKLIEECKNGLNYKAALKYIAKKNYSAAILNLKKLAEVHFKDSEEKLKQCYYEQGCELLKSGKYSDAINNFKLSTGYKETATKLKEAQKKENERQTKEKEKMYKEGVVELNSGNYESAIKIFDSLNNYKDSSKKQLDAKYGYCKAYINKMNNISAKDYYNNGPEQYENSTVENYLEQLKDNSYNGSSYLRDEYNAFFKKSVVHFEIEKRQETSKSKINYRSTIAVKDMGEIKEYNAVVHGTWENDHWFKGDGSDELLTHLSKEEHDLSINGVSLYDSNEKLIMNLSTSQPGDFYYYI